MRRHLLLVLVLYWTIIFILTHIPGERIEGMVKFSDKIAHFVAYAGLATLLYGVIWLRRPRMRFAGWIVIGICMVYGAADELLQIPVGRSCELGDWIANTLGAMTAVTVLVSIRRILETRSARFARTETAIASPPAAG